MENMTPSTEPITEGQIGKFNQNVAALLLKHKNELPKNIFQEILGDETILEEILNSIRKRVDAISNMIVRTVKVNRNLSAKEALSATGRKQYVSDSVVKTMPNVTTQELEVFFFKLSRYVSIADLGKEYDLRGLQPVDPFTLAAINEADPAFADEKPNCTQWKNAEGNWCYACFRHDGGERHLRVRQGDSDWSDDWFCAGVRKAL